MPYCITVMYNASFMPTSTQHVDRYLRVFGRNVKVKRVWLNLTQGQLAERAGLCRTFIGKLERGQAGINVVKLPALARALGVRPAELLPEPQPATLASRAASTHSRPARTAQRPRDKPTRVMLCGRP